jgi:aminoglycoside/choline kinase family phosphotransferase
MDRTALIDQFLHQSGFGTAQRIALPGDASFRRYMRLVGGAQPAMLMDAPPRAGEDCKPFSAIARHLRALNLTAPKILAEDLEQGLLVLEDLGDDLFTRVVTPENEYQLYAAAIDVLCYLRTKPPERLGDYDLPPYDDAVLHREVGLLVDWYLPLIAGQPTAQSVIDEWHGLWAEVWPKAQLQQSVLVLRDFHADNLFWLPDRARLSRVGLIDFQDGLLGDPAYDLVSLLEDARRDVAPILAETMIARYIAHADCDPDRFRIAYDTLAAQRNAKIIGIFARLSERDGKERYLSLIPRVMGLFERDIARTPIFADIARFFDHHVPKALRAQAPATRRAPS